MPRFSATIYKIGINPVVDPPERVLASLFKQSGREKGPIPLRGTINGERFIQTLVKFRGSWRLYINGPMLKASGSKVGDVVKIDLEYDPLPREVAMPVELSKALDRDQRALEAFDHLTPSRQKEILRYIGSLKTASAIKKNVERVIQELVRKS